MRRPPLIAVIALIWLVMPFASAQIPDDDPVDAQLKWYDRALERADLTKGAFSVLRFPAGYEFKPRYRHDPKQKKRILDPDFYCTQCAKEKRIEDPGDRAAHRLVERDEPQILKWIFELTGGKGVFIEDDDFKLFVDLPGFNLKKDWSPQFVDDLKELGDIFPDVTEKTVVIDSHKVAHLYLIRAHRLLRDFWWMVDSSNAKLKALYGWMGPFMGMRGKQEFYIFGSEKQRKEFCDRYIGVASIDSQCWHLFRDRAMLGAMHEQKKGDPQNRNTFNHLLMHNLLDGYRAYTFKIPSWIQMGAAHWVERRENLHFNNWCFSEGGDVKLPNWWRWYPQIRELVSKGEAQPLVEVCSATEFSELPIEYHMIAWSWFCFLLRLGPEKLPIFLNEVKSKAEGESLYDVQTRAFKKAYGVTMLQFDKAWREWVMRTYPAQ